MERYAQFGPLDHPDRVAWYEQIILECSGQFPGVGTAGGLIVVWVGPSSSPDGVAQAAPAFASGATLEEAFESLANELYARLHGSSPLPQVVLLGG